MNNDLRGQTRTRRSLFWRLWFRSLVVRRPQAAVAVVSLLVGAAVASMLLNLYGDVQRKMTQEFRAYGANVVVGPAVGLSPGSGVLSGLIDEAVVERLMPPRLQLQGATVAPVLSVLARVESGQADPRLPEFENVVVTGARLSTLGSIVGIWHTVSSESGGTPGEDRCLVGARLARRLALKPGTRLNLQVEAESLSAPGSTSAGVFRVASIVQSGSSEDDQVFVSLPVLQRLASLEGKVSLIEMIIPGDAAEVSRGIREIQAAVPDLDVRPIRQIVYSQGKVLGTIRWLLISLTALIVLIIALCVMATMTAIVIERRKDIAVMKALGAGNRTVGRLFLSEGATLGLIAGLAGFPLGVVFASGLTRRLFGVRLSVVWWTLPVICVATVLLAVVATYFPVGIIRRIQPAAVLKGE